MKLAALLRRIVLFFFLTALCFALGCSLLKKKLESPKVKVDEVKVQKVENGRVFLDLVLNVNNPNDVDFTVDNMRYSLHVEDKEVASRSLTDDVKIKKNGSTLTAIPIELKLSDLLSSALTLVSGRKLPYHAEGEVKIGPFKIPFEEKGELTIKDF